MYNRYIPQQDGSYRKNRIPEQHPSPAPPAAPAPPCPPPSRAGYSAESFLKQLLPKNLDMGDLLIIILLLLMAGDCQEDQNWALLTLVLYLFL